MDWGWRRERRAEREEDVSVFVTTSKSAHLVPFWQEQVDLPGEEGRQGRGWKCFDGGGGRAKRSIRVPSARWGLWRSYVSTRTEPEFHDRGGAGERPAEGSSTVQSPIFVLAQVPVDQRG